MSRPRRALAALPLFVVLIHASAYGDVLIFADGFESGDTRFWGAAVGACGIACADPVGDGCGASEICDNGSDDDCNGSIDEGCPCTAGAVQPCFAGPPGRRHVGSCVDGFQNCVAAGEFTAWGDCSGGIGPTSEVLDTQDNDCNGCTDDGPSRCNSALTCPAPGDLPSGRPFQELLINGTDFYSDEVESWQWTVSGGPCDQLFVAVNGDPSYTLTGANTSEISLKPFLSGDYLVTTTITLAGGVTDSCTSVVRVGGPGLRVEMCSDRTDTTNLDLHVHQPGTTTPWFTTELANSTINDDDCYYANCSADSFAPANWGYANSPLAECSEGPDGAAWTSLGSCRNPRLERDSIEDEAVPEDIAIDVPEDNVAYRVMVHYYSGTGAAHPMVNVYCGGSLRGTYGHAPALVAGFDDAGGFGGGDMWRVVDVFPDVIEGETTGCLLVPLHPPAQSSGYWITNDDRSY